MRDDALEPRTVISEEEDAIPGDLARGFATTRSPADAWPKGVQRRFESLDRRIAHLEAIVAALLNSDADDEVGRVG